MKNLLKIIACLACIAGTVLLLREFFVRTELSPTKKYVFTEDDFEF